MSLDTVKAIRDFVTAGRATFTLQNTANGTRFTYRVREGEARGEGESRAFFVDVLTGPDNTADYTAMGMLFSDLVIRYRHYDGTWGKRGFRSVISEEAPSARGIAWLVRKLQELPDEAQLPSPIAFHHAGACAKCARPLTDPESLASGWGPVCRERLG